MNENGNTFISTLSTGQRFMVKGSDSIYVVESRTSEPGRTVVRYIIEGTPYRGEFAYPGLTTVQTV